MLYMLNTSIPLEWRGAAWLLSGENLGALAVLGRSLHGSFIDGT